MERREKEIIGKERKREERRKIGERVEQPRRIKG